MESKAAHHLSVSRARREPCIVLCTTHEELRRARVERGFEGNSLDS